MNILVCQPVTESMKARFAAAFPGHDFIYNEHPAQADFAAAGAIFGFPEPDMLKYAENLRFVQLCSSGAEKHNPVVPKDVPLCCATGIFGREIAEVLLGYTLSLYKHLPAYRDKQRRQLWEYCGFNRPLTGANVLILGLGDIGRSFAELLRPFGCRITGLRRNAGERPDCVDGVYTPDKLDELLPNADVVAMCMPDTGDTRGIMTRERIFAMKKGAVLLNVGRGSALDTGALLDAVRSGQLAGAALDVLDTEPLPKEHPLWDEENIILTPHTAGRSYSPWIIEETGRIFEENFSAFLEGRPLVTPVDRETGYMVSRP
ncbi:MAG: D-2-hydroxyacid dehydrogenase [Candidatus Heteroscillospira sp.]|jgi:phosphoglycerate dehydrogenase-like enzyme